MNKTVEPSIDDRCRFCWLRAALWTACALIVTACASPEITRLPKVGSETTCITPAAQQDTVVGVALSGGGSRAALYGAAGLEALGRLRSSQGESVLEQVSYLSSVSGGGLAAAYYALHKPTRETPVLAADGTMTQAYQTFFTDFQTKLAQDFQSALIWRQLGSGRFILNSALAAQSLHEILEESLLGPGTFADLAVRQQSGDSPTLLINSTLYNNGRRFMFTTLTPDAAQYDFIADLDRSLISKGIARSYPEVMKKRWESLLPVSPLELQIDPCPLKVAIAVTASASFPPLVGPITFTVGDELDYWHTGDGGLYENLGLESLLFTFQKQMQDRKVRRALILAFNSSYPFSVGFKQLKQRSQPWTIFNYDFSRIPKVMEERATAYWSLFYRSLQVEGVFPDDSILRIMFLNHESARWEDDLSDLPQACRHEDPPLTSPEDIQQRLAEIPTKFMMESECDRQLLHSAAAKVVVQNQQAIQDFLADRPALRGQYSMKLSSIKPALRYRITHSVRVITLAAMALIGGASGAQARTEIAFWHAMDGQLGDAVSELVRQFNQSQAEFEVKAVYKGTYPQVQASVMSAYRQKNSPHIVQVAEVGTLSMMMSDAIVPVQRLMHQQSIEPDWGDLIETVSGYYAKEGKLASMPFNVSTPILYYNKDIFKKAGLGDTPPATWPEVETASRVILATGAATCGFTTSWPSWTLLENTFAWHDQPFATNQNGYSDLDTKLLINSDFGLMHVGALARWQKERIFSYGGRLEEADIKFINRDCAMLLQSSGSIGSLKKSLGFDWGTAQLPHWGPPYPKANTTLGGATLWVMRGHDPASYKGVVQFLRFVAEPSQQSWWAATTGYLPITKAAVKSLEDNAFYKNNPEQWTGVSQLLNAKPTLTSRGLRLGNYTQVRQAIEMELENIFAGKKSVREGLDAAVLRGNAILRQFSVTNGAAGQGEI